MDTTKADGWTDERTDEQMDRRTYGWTDIQTNGGTYPVIKSFACDSKHGEMGLYFAIRKYKNEYYYR